LTLEWRGLPEMSSWISVLTRSLLDRPGVWAQVLNFIMGIRCALGVQICLMAYRSSVTVDSYTVYGKLFELFKSLTMMVRSS
jgi:hypothetical protein